MKTVLPGSFDCPPRIVTLAKYVWDNEADAHTFLNTAHPLLDGRTPVDIAVSDAGAQQV